MKTGSGWFENTTPWNGRNVLSDKKFRRAGTKSIGVRYACCEWPADDVGGWGMPFIAAGIVILGAVDVGSAWGQREKRMKQQKTVDRRVGAGRGKPEDTLGSNSEIGRKLKQYYDGLITDQVPDRFMELLDKLEEQDDEHSHVDGE